MAGGTPFIVAMATQEIETEGRHTGSHWRKEERKWLRTSAGKKYRKTSPYYRHWTTQRLKKEAVSYHDVCYGPNACYGCKDMIHLDNVINELANRGIEPREELVF